MYSTRLTRKRGAEKLLQEKCRGDLCLLTAEEPVRLADIVTPTTVPNVNFNNSNDSGSDCLDKERRIDAIPQLHRNHIHNNTPQHHSIIAHTSGQPNCDMILKTASSSVTFGMSCVPSLITRLVKLYNESGYPHWQLADALENAAKIGQQVDNHGVAKKAANNHCQPPPANISTSGSQSIHSRDLPPMNRSADDCLECRTYFSLQRRIQMERPVHIGNPQYQKLTPMYGSQQKPPALRTLPQIPFAHLKLPVPRCCNQHLPPPPPQLCYNNSVCFNTSSQPHNAHIHF